MTQTEIFFPFPRVPYRLRKDGWWLLSQANCTPRLSGREGAREFATAGDSIKEITVDDINR